MVQRVFISFEPCYFHEKKELENPLFLMILIESKYILHVINEIIIMIGPLRDIVYTYKYIKKIIALIWIIILDGEAWQFIMSLTLIL